MNAKGKKKEEFKLQRHISGEIEETIIMREGRKQDGIE